MRFDRNCELHVIHQPSFAQGRIGRSPEMWGVSRLRLCEIVPMPLGAATEARSKARGLQLQRAEACLCWPQRKGKHA